MQIYKAPLNDIKFLLNNFLDLSNHQYILSNSDLEISDLEMVIDEAAKICEETLLPLNQSGDLEGCSFDKGKVTTPKGFKEAYKNFIENGWQGIKVNKNYGGQNLPYFMNMIVDEMVSSSNMSFGLYPGLTSRAIDAIEKSGSEELKDLYLPKLTSGEWTGTMNLTEPQCGTDLGLIKTMAIPQDDSSYKITGTKIFITCGEHDLSKNIVHLVLARTPNAPEGIKGISLFLVPKILPNKDGSLGQDNSLQCGSIEKKLGINASPTCVMHYNEAKGWLVGELNKGMKAMFIMMNGARLFVGVQGLGISEIAYQSALYYAKERLQGKATDSKNIADPIIAHPEIRKNLLHMKSLNEGIRALMMWVGSQFDIIKSSDDNKVKNNAENIIALMTPILKSFATDVGCESANLALQIYGGHGYIKDHGMEQLVRDARIAPIYEGTNGIQALDLVGRKMQRNDGEIIENFFSIINNYLNNLSTDKKLETIVKQFKKSFDELVFIANHLRSFNKNKINEINGTAVEFLQMFSYVSIGYIWLKLLIISIEKNNDNSNEFLKSKIATGKYYFNKVLPQTSFLKDHILSGASNYNDYKDEYFDSGFTL
ncbi:MAG: acyl-CoA dehydrogenase C-terminal domain-containing protein [Alphaproteobacteria bacterium]|jgi:alkylation response protein AidB-like acyl-CoA dehydrogenase|nr:acyl-CoA dehydrogenase C-terminal domain-containing protein [Alphaproteobacteria bacterium]